MPVTLVPISADNWQACIRLQPHDDQQHFVSSNLYSLAEAKVHPECVPLAIYTDETMVGFLMYAFETSDNTPWICRLMIAREHQGKGYGRAALQEAIMLIEAQSERDRIMLSFHPDNSIAEQLYRSVGFEPTGETDDEGEIIMCLRLQ